MLIVAIHDVAPSTLSDVRWLLERLDASGVARRVLKVIPAAPGAPDDRDLTALLRREVEAGSEVVLHGWSHAAFGRLRGSLPDRIRARLFAGGAAEFLSLDTDEMDRRMRDGRAWLDERELPAIGFSPPSWLATSSLPSAAAAAGFRYLVMLSGMRDLRTDARIHLPPAGYMGAGPVQEALVRLGGSLLGAPLRVLLRAPAHRVFLHPRRASRSPDCARVLSRIAVLARAHRSITYADLLHD